MAVQKSKKSKNYINYYKILKKKNIKKKLLNYKIKLNIK